MAPLLPSVSQVPGEYLCFLVTRVNERNTIDPEHVMLTLTRLRDFMLEGGIREVSMPVYYPNRGKLNPRLVKMNYPPSCTWSLQKWDNGAPTQEVLLEYRLSFEWTWMS